MRFSVFLEKMMSLLNERNAGAEVKWDADPNGDYLLPGRRAIPHGAECVCQESTFSKVKSAFL